MKLKTQALLYKTMSKVYVTTVHSLIAASAVKGGLAIKKDMNGGYKGSRKEYRKVVVNYWKRYGLRPARFWYGLYAKETKAYDPRYVPDSIWYRYIVPYFNNIMLRNAYAGKCSYDTMYPNLKKPDMVVKNMGGCFYDRDNQLLTREEAINLCAKEDRLILKPATESGEGRSICFFDKQSMTAADVEKYFDTLVSNFVVQRIVKQHPDLAAINESSLNTVRVISLFFKDEVHILSAQLRMGINGAKVDNFGAGGTACSIKPDGWLEELAITRQYTWTDAHPNGMKFKDIRVPSYDKIISAIKETHSKLPYMRLVGWDFAVDDQGDPVFIEMNIKMAQNQIGSGKPAFGDLTEEVLEDVFIKKTLKKHIPIG